MTDFSITFTRKVELAGDMTIFYFEKPEGYAFKAGQWCFLTVPETGYQDERGLRRPFSIASSPLEQDLIFATKLSGSAMKKTMAGLEPGATVSLGSPMGLLFLPAGVETPLIFLAGGVGITPFRSMIRYVADAPTEHTITLFYSSRTPEETPFLDELLTISKSTPRITTAITMTRATEGSHWDGLTGRLNPNMIKMHCNAWERARYFIVGPTNMAEAMTRTLEELGIGRDRITLELFAGS
ncbi:MAG TPA: FAD-dependent oxidoreductase [Syntrophorhabdaceae bacterium]|jgi:ferredoxin-NADP reductase